MKSSNANESLSPTRSPNPSYNSRMEAIACGVQARLEERTGYSRKITDETVDIARTLGVADREIVRWVNQRQSQLADTEEKIRGIKSIVYRAGQ